MKLLDLVGSTFDLGISYIPGEKEKREEDCEVLQKIREIFEQHLKGSFGSKLPELPFSITDVKKSAEIQSISIRLFIFLGYLFALHADDLSGCFYLRDNESVERKRNILEEMRREVDKKLEKWKCKSEGVGDRNL